MVLDDAPVAMGQSVPEACEVGRPQALLACAMQHMHASRLVGQPLGKRAGAIGRVVVHDEDVDVGVDSQDSGARGTRLSRSL